MLDILFLDIEMNPRTGKVDYGATFKGQELHERNSYRLAQWITEAN